MSGGTPLITDIEAIANDTRLPSRAAVGRQLGIDPGQPALQGNPRLAQGAADGASLSAAARVISELLGATPMKGEAVSGSAPLWPATAAPRSGPVSGPEPQQLAAALARSVAGSGLFYESHLLQFFTGERSLAQLQHEPQAKLVLPSAAADAEAATTPTASHVTANIAAEAVPLVRQQLELLALSQFRWSGEAWPDAGMEWEITEQGRRQPDDSAPRSWSTCLSMTLPRLGGIELRLSLANHSWRADLRAAEATTLGSMQAASAQLQQRFSAAGLHLSGLQVVQLPQAGLDNPLDTKNDNKNK
ncbi:flagellar hook-length control FliK family protein [Collimonas fungivorans]|uniref:Flagellar hook-length control FliK family protein n=1 Tax=Collimonas fungivorans TaxID=158899 RepID=A0A127P817_9BURK|nr:flagellar hook-length control protein FliK [Collimonas fungivorans]AMO93962.1 flagellar hook-length control FliK family protein [Collimonas fungivorans]